tara:strand:+ start:650 stop:1021 length:372 start_codon:yes stop_codon:yes gene_type:complete
MLQALIGPIANLASGYLSNKHEQAQAKHQAKLQVIKNDADWESKMADASANSWKDEWFAILLSAPIVAVLYGVGFNDPAVMGRVHDAFEALGNLPEWYQYLLFIAVTSSFGIRGADKLMKLRK